MLRHEVRPHCALELVHRKRSREIDGKRQRPQRLGNVMRRRGVQVGAVQLVVALRDPILGLLEVAPAPKRHFEIRHPRKNRVPPEAVPRDAPRSGI
eukprot:scaffold1499_cov255-Pinguiococcus_pyrenoidosus.AAC.1